MKIKKAVKKNPDEDQIASVRARTWVNSDPKSYGGAMLREWYKSNPKYIDESK